jgi:hypothetical protein
LNGLDDLARSSNRICPFLAFGGRFPCKFDFEDSLESGSRDFFSLRADGAEDLRCGFRARLDQIIDHSSDDFQQKAALSGNLIRSIADGWLIRILDCRYAPLLSFLAPSMPHLPNAQISP